MQSISISIAKSVATAPQIVSQRVLETAAMFGLGVDEQRRLTVVPPCTIAIPLPGIVFITGPSGGGKSTILSLIAHEGRQRGLGVIGFDELPAPAADVPLVDALGSTLSQAASLLSLAGLGDAFVMVRRPSELSDGQRYRFTLARTMELAQRQMRPSIIVADEFGATLDRLTAQTLARNIRRWINRPRNGTADMAFICATTHDYLLEALEPNVLIWKGLGDQMEMVAR